MRLRRKAEPHLCRVTAWDLVQTDGAVSIVLADDHAVMRGGLRMLLDAEPSFDLVAEAGTIQSVFRGVRTHRPHVLVLDLNIPGGSSVEAIARIARFSPSTAVVVLTMEDDAGFKSAAFAAGARGYVLKDAAPRDLVRAISSAIAPASSPPAGLQSQPPR
jgi:two-component system, NarL family, response regulator NreC